MQKRYQFTNHARKLALFASGEPSEGSSSSEDEEDQDDDEEDDDDDEAEEEDEASPGVKRKKKRSNKAVRLGEARQQEEAESLSQNKTQKRRLSSGSGSDSAGKKDNGDHDALSPKKPRLQKASPKVNRKKKKKNKNPFRDQLMIPETMTDIPSDLDTSYYIVPLPIGHRCFVISADGRTMARLPTGQLLVSPFESCLPAGSSQYRGNRRSDYCILDCVYSSVTRTFWTLDIMCWRGHPVYECETEFRFWWLRGKLAEIESLQAKWIATQTREWEQEQAKKRQKKARQIKKRQERAALASATVPMDIASIQSALESDMILQEEGDDGDDEAGTETMEAEHYGRTGCAQPSATTARKTFWPIVFTPLPYFNASVDLVRLLAEVMYQPTPAQSSTASPMMLTADDQADPGSVVIPSSSLQPSLVSAFEHPSSAGAAILDQQRGSISVSSSFKTIGGSGSTNRGSGTLPTVRTYREAHSFGTMALTGEIATAASLFPAHDATQRSRQGQALGFERAAGLVFFNKKTMYVLGTTPLCGWLTMDQIGDVFFGEEGGVGPVAGTSAVEGREVEMEDALERIRI
ncbi:hypothetical protein BGX28_009818 [Mortierella sp. GBA30]|nr:hypothetical protein BGX28_009818 [Mortierella sp. GBA30]